MKDIRLRPEASTDVAEAVEWYETERRGLGVEFLLELDAAIERAAESPLAYAVQYRDARRILLRSFPFSVYFLVADSAIEILGVLHQHRAPSAWRSRL